MIFIELPSEFSYVFQFHEKRKRERKKGGEKFFERIFLTLTNFQFLERLNWIIHSQLFRNFPNRLRINIKTRVWCLIPESKQAHVPIFSKRKFTTFHTHTHIRTQPRKSAHATKKLPSCRGQLLHPSPFPLPSLVLFRPVITIYALERPFLFVSHCLSIPNQRFLSRFIDRLSRYWIVRSILTTFVYLYRCYAEYLRDVNQIPFVELSCFVFFRSTRLLLLFSIGWKMVDRLESCWKYFERR